MRCVDALVIQCPPRIALILIVLSSSSFSHLLELLKSSSLELFNCYSPPLRSVGDEIQFEFIDPFFRCTDHQLTAHILLLNEKLTSLSYIPASPVGVVYTRMAVRMCGPLHNPRKLSVNFAHRGYKLTFHKLVTCFQSLCLC